MLKGLRDFLMRGNVVDLAVAVIVGAAFNQVINSLVADVLTPILGALGGIPDFSAFKIGPVAIGRFINAVLNFLVVGTAIYFMVVPMNKLSRLIKEHKITEETRLLREILEELKKGRNSP
jgi:large conductance mechanosensitive channel